MNMLDSKGPEYVGQWLSNIAARAGLAHYEIAPIITRVTGQTGLVADDNPALVIEGRMREVVGALDGPTAKQIVAEARALARQLYPYGRCHFCGLKLNARHQCTECI